MDRKPIFDAVDAKVPGIWNIPGAIHLMDSLLDLAEKQAPSTAGFDEAVLAHLRFEEGVRPRAYKDHLGYWTIGIGRLIDPRKGGRITPEEDAILMANDPSRKGKAWTEYVLTEAEMDMLKRNDVARFVASMADWPAWAAVQGNVARMVALTSMCFQLGTAGLREFVNTLALVADGKFVAAADNMLKSKWAKQTPERAGRIATMMRTGRMA